MGIDVKLTIAHPSLATPTARSWPGLDKKQVNKLTSAMTSTLHKLNQYGQDRAEGKQLPSSPANTQPKATAVVDFVATEGGQPWSLAHFEWPGLADGDIQFITGVFDGEFAKVKQHVGGGGGSGEGGGQRGGNR